MMEITKLISKSNELRKDVISMIYHGGSGHPGGCLSAAEIITALYYNAMNLNPNSPAWERRDRLVLSKGHACPMVYAALADRGYFHKDILKTLRHTGSILQGHPDWLKTPGLDATSGSLGQGLSIGAGMALASIMKSIPYYVYVVMSDGEMQEGMTWEAAMFVTHYKCTNLIAIIDSNNLQVDGRVSDVMSIEPLASKWEAFGWNVTTVDGHDIESIINALSDARAQHDDCSAIICKTIKGKGVSFMEDIMEWHANPITKDLYDKAMSDLCSGSYIND